MALINCKECNNQISDTASACPKCGAPVNSTVATVSQKKSSSSKIAITVVIVLVCLVGGFALLNQMNISTSSTGESYQEKVMTVEEIEKADPTRFLSADGTWSENFWGNKYTINGTVTNSATVANYKDVVINVTFYTKTKSEISSKQYVLYEFVPAHSTKKFEWKLERPNGAESLGWDVSSAEAY
jgi:hypothetical protein